MWEKYGVHIPPSCHSPSSTYPSFFRSFNLRQFIEVGWWAVITGRLMWKTLQNTGHVLLQSISGSTWGWPWQWSLGGGPIPPRTHVPPYIVNWAPLLRESCEMLPPKSSCVSRWSANGKACSWVTDTMGSNVLTQFLVIMIVQYSIIRTKSLMPPWRAHAPSPLKYKITC